MFPLKQAYSYIHTSGKAALKMKQFLENALEVIFCLQPMLRPND